MNINHTWSVHQHSCKIYERYMSEWYLSLIFIIKPHAFQLVVPFCVSESCILATCFLKFSTDAQRWSKEKAEDDDEGLVETLLDQNRSNSHGEDHRPWASMVHGSRVGGKRHFTFTFTHSVFSTRMNQTIHLPSTMEVGKARVWTNTSRVRWFQALFL